MLARYAKINKQGEFTVASKKATQFGYGNMLYLRLMIALGRSYNLAKIATIGIRYSFVRRQFKDPATEQERQIIDYQAQRYRLFPVVGCAYILNLGM